jgi:hypothetical protein
MKVAVLKIGGRIHNEAKVPGPIGEVLFIIQMLVAAGCDVHAYSLISKKKSEIPGCILHDITSEDELEALKTAGFDACVVVNGSVNFFGGEYSPEQILNFRVMHDLAETDPEIRFFYCLTDGKLGLSPLVPKIKNRPWASDFDLERLTIDDCRFSYVSQLYDKPTNLKLIEKLKVPIEEVFYFPFEKIPLLKEGVESPSSLLEDDRDIDILYVGGFRGGSRAKKMVEYFYGLPDDISIMVRGTIDAKDFQKLPVSSLRPPIFGTKVSYSDLFRVLSGSKAVICIGDPMYHGAGISTRVYEAIASGQVTFIDVEYDPNRFVYRNPTLRDFCYVSGRKDLVEKVRILKDGDLRSKISDLQKKDTLLNKTEFSNDFVKILKGETKWE